MTADELIRRANGGIVGIDEGMLVYSGYDSAVDHADATARGRPEWIHPDDHNEDNEIALEEKHKLADAMIARWARYKKEAK